MIPILRNTAALTMLAGSLAFCARAAETPAGLVDFGKFNPPSGGSQFIEVNLNAQLIGLAARLTEKQEPEIAELLKGLISLRVNVIGIEDGNREEMTDRVTKLRAELASTGWDRLVTVQEKGQDVGVYLKQRGEEAIEGIVVTVIDGNKEAIFVNVVGDIRPEKIAELGERFHIEPLKKAGKWLPKS